MNTSPSSKEPTQRRLKAIIYPLSALLGLGLVIWLNIWKPIWLAPRWFRYTPFVYASLILAWLPLLICALRQLASRRWLLVLMVCILLGQCCGGFLFFHRVYVELVDLGLFGGSLGMQSLSCRYESPSAEQTLYHCELCLGSSDIPQKMILTYKFKILGGSPFMLLLESDARYRDGGTCSPSRFR
jgi:hypothetical protein